MKKLIFIILLVGFGVTVQAKMYKCTDATGKLSFQDRPCAGDVSQKEIKATSQFSDSLSKKAAARAEASLIGKRAFTIAGEIACYDASTYRLYNNAVDSRDGHPWLYINSGRCVKMSGGAPVKVIYYEPRTNTVSFSTYTHTFYSGRRGIEIRK